MTHELVRIISVKREEARPSEGLEGALFRRSRFGFCAEVKVAESCSIDASARGCRADCDDVTSGCEIRTCLLQERHCSSHRYVLSRKVRFLLAMLSCL